MKRQLHLFSVICLAILLVPALAHAACSSPAGSEGDLRYDSTAKTIYFCDDTNWIAMGGSGSSPRLPTAVRVTSAAMTDGNLGGWAAFRTYMDSNSCSGYEWCRDDELAEWFRAGNTTITGGVSGTAYWVYETSSCNNWTSNASTSRVTTVDYTGGNSIDWGASADERCDTGARIVVCCQF